MILKPIVEPPCVLGSSLTEKPLSEFTEWSFRESPPRRGGFDGLFDRPAIHAARCCRPFAPHPCTQRGKRADDPRARFSQKPAGGYFMRRWQGMGAGTIPAKHPLPVRLPPWFPPKPRGIPKGCARPFRAAPSHVMPQTFHGPPAPLPDFSPTGSLNRESSTQPPPSGGARPGITSLEKRRYLHHRTERRRDLFCRV